MKTENGKARAVAHFGSQRALARALGISVQAVNKWREIPVHQVLTIERLSGGAVSRSQMRPELWPPKDAA